MVKASDNEFPSFLVKEGTAPASPAAGDQRLFIDSADHVLKRKNSSGTVTSVESSGGAPSTAQYIVGVADGTLSAEKVRADLYKNYNPDSYPASDNAVSNE